MPVPPKAEIYPEKVAADLPAPSGDPDPPLAAFYDELRKNGVDVLDLAATFRANKAGEHGPVFCKTDTHWSGAGCVLAAQEIAAEVHAKLGASRRARENLRLGLEGNLHRPATSAACWTRARKNPAEKISVRQLTETVAPEPRQLRSCCWATATRWFSTTSWPNAPACSTNSPSNSAPCPTASPSVGSGATPVRIDLYRRSLKEPGYLAKKKVVVWCFTAREFTEAAQGWQKAAGGEVGTQRAPAALHRPSCGAISRNTPAAHARPSSLL